MAMYARRDPGVPIDFTQMEFADESFDLVVFQIVVHETTSHGLPSMIGVSWRVLKPDGSMSHADAATQPERLGLCDQVLDEFHVLYNGEPSWMGWADADVLDNLREVDFPEVAALAEYLVPLERGAQW